MLSIISHTAIRLLTTSIILILCIAFAAYHFITQHTDDSYVQVAEQLRNVKTMQYTVRMPYHTGDYGPKTLYNVYYRNPGITRIENKATGQLCCIYDRIRKKYLVEYDNYTAITTVSDREVTQIDTWHGVLADMPVKYAKDIDVRSLRGSRVHVYQASSDDLTMYIWVSSNNMPVQIECFPADEPKTPENTALIRDIRINPDLPERLFNISLNRLSTAWLQSIDNRLTGTFRNCYVQSEAVTVCGVLCTKLIDWPINQYDIDIVLIISYGHIFCNVFCRYFYPRFFAASAASCAVISLRES